MRNRWGEYCAARRRANSATGGLQRGNALNQEACPEPASVITYRQDRCLHLPLKNELITASSSLHETRTVAIDYPPILAWGCADMLSEEPSEVTLLGKSKVLGELAKGAASLALQP